MRLTIVGCSGSMSGPDSAASCYLVQAPHRGRTYSLVLDCGPGSAGQLFRYLDPREVDAFGLSHLHPDHCADLCSYYVAARYSPTAAWPVRPVYGPSGTALRLARAYAADLDEVEPGPGFGQQFDWKVWGAEQDLGPFRVRAVRVEHPVEAYALRVEERAGAGGVLVYSGDTGPCDALVSLSRGADLLLAEASFRDQPGNPAGLHLSGREAASAAESAAVGALVLTHIPPWHDRDEVHAEAAPHFSGPVSMAVPGASWLIGAPGGARVGGG